MRSNTFSLLVLLGIVSGVGAEPLREGSTTVPVRLTQDIRLFPGTPLNPGTQPVVVPSVVNGQFRVDWANQASGDSFAEVTYFLGTGRSAPGDIIAGLTGGPYRVTFPATPGGFEGTLTNINEDDGTLVTADLNMFLTQGVTLANGIQLFSIDDPNGGPGDQPAFFLGEISFNPPPGTEYASDSVTNLYTNIPGVGPVAVGQVFNQVATAIAVPEPATLWAFAFALIGFGYFSVRRRKRS